MADFDLLGKHQYTTQAPETPRPCPGCGNRMNTINAGTDSSVFLLERCDQCLGLFFDPGELDSLIEHNIRAVFTVDRLALAGLAAHKPEDQVCYRKCPLCANLMNRVNFGNSSGVIVDHCRDHGIYLDAGELHHILKWVRSGGKIASPAQTPPVNMSRDHLPGLPPPEQREDPLLDQIVEFVVSLFGSPRI